VNDSWKEVFEECRQANADLLHLVEALVDVSRYETGCGIRLNYELLNWEKIFVKVIAQNTAALKPELALIYKISPSLPCIYGDRLQIQRVLQNLLENAVRVSKPHKEIVLEVAPFKEDQVQVCVRDQGSGIVSQEQEQLFYRFVQGRNQRGKSGLGLYLCRQIVEAHGGSIGVESSLGEGSTFWFTLPAHTDKARF
jgi:signal transduction histidine kinase